MGTPDFAVPSLERLIENGYNISCVVTQPDRPKGRKRILTPPPVKVVALKNDLRVMQPEKVKNPEFFKALASFKPDLIVVVAFGQILPKEILELPSIGCINVHASLLPKYRGAAPIQWAIINGESETGVSTMWMDEGLDTGDIFLQESIKIEQNWTSYDLANKLSILGGNLLIKTLEHIQNNKMIHIPQEDENSSYAPMLTRSHGEIDWSRSTKEIHNLIRGLYPWPGAFTKSNGKEIKIWKAKIYSSGKEDLPGKYLGKVNNQGFLVSTVDGCLLIEELQETGKKRMSAIDYLAGHNMFEGDYFADVK